MSDLSLLAGKLRSFAKGLVSGSEIHDALHEAAAELEKVGKDVEAGVEKVATEVEKEVVAVVDRITGKGKKAVANTVANTVAVANTVSVNVETVTANTAG